MKKTETPFWKVKTLEQMTRREWESLCDGCGRCCLEKLENRKTGKVFFTSVACRYLDTDTCRCKAYERRRQAAPWCLILSWRLIPKIRWLPRTCAYRLLSEKKELAWWHPLVSGDPNTVREAGIWVGGKIVSSEYVHPDDLENFIVDWKLWENLGVDLEKKILPG